MLIPRDNYTLLHVWGDHEGYAYNESLLYMRSSRGPVREPSHEIAQPERHRRIKPDVVAPGVNIISANTRYQPAFYNDLPMSLGLTSDSGTSMAAPMVAGCAATLRSALIGTGRGILTSTDPNNKHAPSAALIKALLINGAVKLAGEVPPPPQALASGSAGAYPVTHGYVDYASAVGALGLGTMVNGVDQNSWHRVLPLPAGLGGRTSKVTLVYTDHPGAMLQNRLLLTVRHSGIAGPRRGDTNGDLNLGVQLLTNVQQVEWEKMQAGHVGLCVAAEHIVGANGRQPFAIV